MISFPKRLSKNNFGKRRTQKVRDGSHQRTILILKVVPSSDYFSNPLLPSLSQSFSFVLSFSLTPYVFFLISLILSHSLPNMYSLSFVLFYLLLSVINFITRLPKSACLHFLKYIFFYTTSVPVSIFLSFSLFQLLAFLILPI